MSFVPSSDNDKDKSKFPHPVFFEGNLVNECLSFLEHQVKEDREACFFALLTGISKDFKEPQNLFMRGSSSTGKTWITTNVLKLFDNEDVWALGGLSPKALIHTHGTQLDKEGNEIDFNDRPNKDLVKDELTAQFGKEPSNIVVFNEYHKKMSVWNERLKDSYVLVDLTGKLLVFLDVPDVETFQTLLPILSHDKEEIEYRFTNKTVKGQLRTELTKIKGWPATIFCTASQKGLETFSSRSFTISPKTSELKISEAMKVSGSGLFVKSNKIEKELFQLKHKLWGLLDSMKDGKIDVFIPYEGQLASVMPHYGARVMRDFKHLLTFIKLHALMNINDRPRIYGLKKERSFEDSGSKTTYDFDEYGSAIVDDSKTVVLATFTDLFEVAKNFMFIEETTITGLSQNILDVYNKVIVPLGSADYQTLVTKTSEILDISLSSKTLYRYVNELSKLGWVDEIPDPDDKRKKTVTALKNKRNRLFSSLDELPSLFKAETLKDVLLNNLKIVSQNEISREHDLHLAWKENDIEQTCILNEDSIISLCNRICIGASFRFNDVQMEYLKSCTSDLTVCETNFNGDENDSFKQTTLEKNANSSREESRQIQANPGLKCGDCYYWNKEYCVGANPSLILPSATYPETCKQFVRKVEG